MANSAASQKATFNWADPLLLDQQLTEDERMIRDAAQQYSQDKLLPRVVEAFRNEHTDIEIFREMGALGIGTLDVADEETEVQRTRQDDEETENDFF